MKIPILPIISAALTLVGFWFRLHSVVPFPIKVLVSPLLTKLMEMGSGVSKVVVMGSGALKVKDFTAGQDPKSGVAGKEEDDAAAAIKASNVIENMGILPCS